MTTAAPQPLHGPPVSRRGRVFLLVLSLCAVGAALALCLRDRHRYVTPPISVEPAGAPFVLPADWYNAPPVPKCPPPPDLAPVEEPRAPGPAAAPRAAEHEHYLSRVLGALTLSMVEVRPC